MADPYHLTTTVGGSFDEAVVRVTEALKQQGFGVLTDIDVQATMQKKLGKDMPRYRILGACNPQMAWRALELEPRIGTMLPCNVIVRETAAGVEVSAVDPAGSMQAVANPGLAEVAATVRGKLAAVIAAL